MYRVDAARVEAFQRDGHVVVRGLATHEEIAAIRPVIERVVDDVAAKHDPQGRIDDYSKLFTQVTNVWRVNDDARRVVFNRKFASVAAQLLGVDAVRLYHDQALFKPPGAGRTPWHQDRYYWPLDTDRTVTMWLPLVDIDDAIGPMRFASRSHLSRDLGDLAISNDVDARLAQEVERRGWPVVDSPIRAGDATFHAGGTIHSAGANRSDRVREVLTIIYFADGARVAEPANPNQRVDMDVFIPGAKPGDIAASELNPVLYTAAAPR